MARPDGKPESDPIRVVLDRIGDKWSFLILLELAEGAVRFGQLKSRMGGISRRMLTLTLRSLARDGFVERQVFPTTPPSVEYRLSHLGASFLDPMNAIQQWATAKYHEIRTARGTFDASEASRGASDPAQ